jgi:hypothetical protein
VASDLSWILAGQLNGSANFSAPAIVKARQSIFADLLGDYRGARDVLQTAFSEKIQPTLQGLDQALSHQYEQRNLLADLLADGISTIPGIDVMLAGDVLNSIESIRKGLESQGGEIDIPIANGTLDLVIADGQQRHETFVVKGEPLTSSDTSGLGLLDVTIKQPWDYARSETTYPNRHITDLDDFTTTPFTTQWNIEYHGSFEITVGVPENEVEWSSDASCSSIVQVDGAINILTFSGWGLNGVEYASTVTLAQDIKDFLIDIWDFLTSTVCSIGSMLGKTFSIFGQLVSDLLAYATAPLEVLNNILSEALDKMKEASENLIGTVIQALADSITAVMNGTTLKLSILGVAISMVVGPSDSAMARVQDRLRTDISLSIFGVVLTSSVRIIRMGDGQHTLTATASLSGNEWSADLTFDPLLQVFEHQVEVRGYCGGHILEIVAPEVERVQKVTVALSDIPGLSLVLKGIPSPVPGTNFNIDGGLEFSFNVLDRSSVLINEIELNPKGKDASHEWVELFNPSNSPVDVSGWMLSTSRGQQHQEAISGVIPAYGYLVHYFSGQALDNGEVKGFPLQESVTLLDTDGTRVDSAPWMKDLNDDDRTWQRTFDGSSRWVFRNQTKSVTNGLVLLTEMNAEWLVSTAADCFTESFEKFIDGGFDMWALDRIIRDALSSLEQRLLEMIENTISSMRFYLQLGLSDVSGVSGGGLAVSLVYDGRAVRECMDWLIHSIGELLRDPLNPLALAGRTKVAIETLADHAYLQIGLFVTVGAPAIMEFKTAVRWTATAVVRTSLGSLGVFGGNNGWNLDFGLVISGVQSIALKDRSPSMKTACYDVWALRGSLRPA